jgi:hypothetical protein
MPAVCCDKVRLAISRGHIGKRTSLDSNRRATTMLIFYSKSEFISDIRSMFRRVQYGKNEESELADHGHYDRA